jgi:hypothetical protein
MKRLKLPETAGLSANQPVLGLTVAKFGKSALGFLCQHHKLVKFAIIMSNKLF